MKHFDPFWDEATPEERKPPSEPGMTPDGMSRAIKHGVAEHKAHCDGKLVRQSHLDATGWFAWTYQCSKCGTAVLVKQARRPAKKYQGWNQVEFAFPKEWPS